MPRHSGRASRYDGMTPTALLVIPLVIASSAATAEDQGAAAPAPTWVNISAAFTKQIGADDYEPAHHRRCIGLIVTPDGDLYIETATKGVCVSKDQGATWSVVGGNGITGRCETGDGFSMAYPYDGRMAFFCCDGSGGMTLDGGATWRPFGTIQRMLEFADVDWSVEDPRTVFGMTHEPYCQVLSEDGGRSWRGVGEDTPESRSRVTYYLGVIDAKTVVRASVKHGGIELSGDLGQTWTRTSDQFVVGRRPVHYGTHLYWTTTDGVIVSRDGKEWAVTGPGAGYAHYGPYFAASEQEFMVVTEKSFLATHDGGKTWQALAATFLAPDGFRPQYKLYAYYGWDAKRNILYTSGLAGSVYQLRLK
jgi:hypothetical protein